MSIIHRSPPHKKVGLQTCTVFSQQQGSGSVAFGFLPYEISSVGGGHRIYAGGDCYTSNSLTTLLNPYIYLQNGGGLGSLQVNVSGISIVGTGTRGGTTNTWIDVSTFPIWNITKLNVGSTRWRLWVQLRDKASLRLISNVYTELYLDIISTPTTPPCPDPMMKIELADGTQILAKDLKVGMFVKGMHEITKEWGAYEVTRADLAKNYKVKVLFTDGTEVKCSENHRFFINDSEMIKALHLTPGYKLGDKEVEDVLYIGEGDVIHIEVDQAHTYIMEGLLSHNNKP